MKVAVCLALLSFCLSSIPKVNSIKCAQCDPQAMYDCEDIPIDCTDDEELGHAFDSCFTYEMVAQRQDGTNFTHKIKNCSIRDGCEELRNLMCDNANKTLNKLVKSCSITCCDHSNYCNADNDFIWNVELLPTEHRTSEPDVMGYRSGSSASLTMLSWLLHLSVLSLFLYFTIE